MSRSHHPEFGISQDKPRLVRQQLAKTDDAKAKKLFLVKTFYLQLVIPRHPLIVPTKLTAPFYGLMSVYTLPC